MEYAEGLSRSVFFTDNFVFKIKKIDSRFDQDKVRKALECLVIDTQKALQSGSFLHINKSYSISDFLPCSESQEELSSWMESENDGIRDLLCPVIGGSEDGSILIQPRLETLSSVKEVLYQNIIDKVGRYTWASHTLGAPSKNLGIIRNDNRLV